jgi:hypothetical protein
VDLVEPQRDVEGTDARFFMLPAQVIEQLIGGDREFPYSTFQEVTREGGLRCNHQLGWVRPATHLPEEGPYPAEVLLVRPFLRSYLGYRKAEHILKVRGGLVSNQEEAGN